MKIFYPALTHMLQEIARAAIIEGYRALGVSPAMPDAQRDALFQRDALLDSAHAHGTLFVDALFSLLPTSPETGLGYFNYFGEASEPVSLSWEGMIGNNYELSRELSLEEIALIRVDCVSAIRKVYADNHV
jgi:hypothetical protein